MDYNVSSDPGDPGEVSTGRHGRDPESPITRVLHTNVRDETPVRSTHMTPLQDAGLCSPQSQSFP